VVGSGYHRQSDAKVAPFCPSASNRAAAAPEKSNDLRDKRRAKPAMNRW